VSEQHTNKQLLLQVTAAPSARAEDGHALRYRRVDARAAHERTLAALLPTLRGFLFRLLGPRTDLDDATQDALIALSDSLPRLADPAQLKSFAKTICLRVAYRYYARRARLEPLEPEQHQAPGPLADESLARRRLLIRLHRCLEKLPHKRRTAFVLCAIEGLSPHEAAELEGVSPGSMRARYMHAREELQRLLSKTVEDVHE
jgi:RNA polymerase sigma-70 factor (ECF subfamily)